MGNITLSHGKIIYLTTAICQFAHRPYGASTASVTSVTADGCHPEARHALPVDPGAIGAIVLHQQHVTSTLAVLSINKKGRNGEKSATR